MLGAKCRHLVLFAHSRLVEFENHEFSVMFVKDFTSNCFVGRCKCVPILFAKALKRCQPLFLYHLSQMWVPGKCFARSLQPFEFCELQIGKLY